MLCFRKTHNKLALIKPLKDVLALNCVNINMLVRHVAPARGGRTLFSKPPSLSEALNAPITCNFLEACRYEWADC